MKRYKPVLNDTGAIIVTILIITLFISVVVSALIVYATSNVSRGRNRVLTLESQYAAESGADAAIGYLNNDPAASYTGTGGAERRIRADPDPWRDSGSGRECQRTIRT